MYTNVCPLGIMASAADECVGGELSEPDGDRCCSWKTWNNGTYLSIKGEKSLQFYNERRIQSACIQLDQRSDPNTPKLVDLAYDLSKLGQSVVVDPDFLERFPRAVWNFYTLFPPQRWYTAKNAVPTDCQSDGAYNVWRENPNPSPPQDWDKAARDVVQPGQTIEQWLGSRLASASPSQRGAFWTMRTVPGGGPYQLVQSLPNNDDVYKVPNDLYRIEAGTLVPTDWVRSFMDTFAPKKMLLLPLFQKLSMPSAEQKPSITAAPKLEMVMTKFPTLTKSQPVTEEDLVSALPPDEGAAAFEVKTWMLAVGGVAFLGLVGGGVYLATR
jgi:hypothetical protein